jgi:N-acetylneuraminate synthase
VKGSGKWLYFDTAGEQSLRIAQQVGADGVKIHATNFYNTDLVREALATMPAVFISLGGISVGELEDFIQYHSIRPDGRVRLLYGFQAEPTPVDANNLLRIGAIRRRLPGYPIGFMDHADGAIDDAQTLSLLALPLGISFIEKHLTLDRELQLEDFVSALSPSGFRGFVARIRRLEGALGSENLELTEIEKQYRRKVLRVVVAAADIPKGTPLIRQQVALKRVGTVKDTPIFRKGEAVGRKLRVDIQKNQQITREMLE